MPGWDVSECALCYLKALMCAAGKKNHWSTFQPYCGQQNYCMRRLKISGNGITLIFLLTVEKEKCIL